MDLRKYASQGRTDPILICYCPGGRHALRAHDAKDHGSTAEKLALAAIEEARMVLPGIQALFGFQLIAAFNQQFETLSRSEKLFHFAALLLVAVAIAVIMAPAAYHRIAERGSMSPFFVRLASRLVATAMAPLMIALCLDVYLLGRVITHLASLAAAVASALLLLFVGLWYGYPLLMLARNGASGR